MKSYHTLSKLECKCKLWGKREAWVTQYGVTTCCSSQARASGSPTGKAYINMALSHRSRCQYWYRLTIPKSSRFPNLLLCCLPVQMVPTCPCNWNCLASVVLVLLGGSVQLDPRVLPADWLLAVLILTLILRPLLQGSQIMIEVHLIQFGLLSL